MINPSDYIATCQIHGVVDSYFLTGDQESDLLCVCYLCSVKYLSEQVGSLTMTKKENDNEKENGI